MRNDHGHGDLFSLAQVAMPKAPHTSAQSRDVSAQVYSSLTQRAQKSGLPVRPLHVGDTYLDPPPVARAENQRLAEHPAMHAYAPVQGEPTLRDAFVFST